MKKYLGLLAGAVLMLTAAISIAEEQKVEKKEDPAQVTCHKQFPEAGKAYDDCVTAEKAKTKTTSQAGTGEKKAQ